MNSDRFDWAKAKVAMRAEIACEQAKQITAARTAIHLANIDIRFSRHIKPEDPCGTLDNALRAQQFLAALAGQSSPLNQALAEQIQRQQMLSQRPESPFFGPSVNALMGPFGFLR